MEEKKRRIFISLPITGHENTVKQRLEQAKRELEATYKGEPIEFVYDPDIDSICDNDSGVEISMGDKPFCEIIGNDIALMLSCDTVYITKGFYYSRGCRIEDAVARADKMDVILQPGAWQPLEKED